MAAVAAMCAVVNVAAVAINNGIITASGRASARVVSTEALLIVVAVNVRETGCNPGTRLA
jgi:hypothetical protein